MKHLITPSFLFPITITTTIHHLLSKRKRTPQVHKLRATKRRQDRLQRFHNGRDNPV